MDRSLDHARIENPGPRNLVFEDRHPALSDSRQELLEGLLEQPKRIAPKFFYDEYGSRLFEQITRLPEYYPTRTEERILRSRAAEMASCTGPGCILLEPGCGSCRKIRLLLHALRPELFVPQDISAGFLRRAAVELAGEYPWLKVHALCSDFTRPGGLPTSLPAGRRVLFYPGSTIGNLDPKAATAFLDRWRRWLGPDGGLLLGVDRHKDTARLEAAYNDSRGITAEFNLHLIDRINHLLEGSLSRSDFHHLAFYDSAKRRIEMHLLCLRDHEARVGDRLLRFEAGERIHTENSWKYTPQSLAELAARAGLAVRKTWSDPEELFSVCWLEPLP